MICILHNKSLGQTEMKTLPGLVCMLNLNTKYSVLNTSF
jgi:hypothetical protein